MKKQEVYVISVLFFHLSMHDFYTMYMYTTLFWACKIHVPERSLY